MALRAVSGSGIMGHNGFTPQRVDAMSDQFDVSGPDTCADAAKVIAL